MYLAFALHASLCVFIHMVLGNAELEEFEKFNKQFNKVYKNAKEYQYRLSVFTANLKAALQIQKAELGTAEYGITEYSDLTDEEFLRSRLTSVGAFPPNNVKQLKVEAQQAHASCDWRKAGVISEVKRQGKCGSCWAFASVGNIEAQWAILGHPVNLSVQQVLDCGPCESGCKGGYFWDAYRTVIEQNGLQNEEDYPYEEMTLNCRTDHSKIIKGIYDFIMLPKNEKDMASYVSNNGTIAVGINAAPLKSYINGVIRNSLCDANHVNHAVLLVGYSKDKEGRYWIVKNSWGKTWGENGFFRISFGNNMCGITKWPLSAIVTKPGSRKQDLGTETCTRTRSEGRDLYKKKIRGQGPVQEQDLRAGTSTRRRSEGRDLYKNKIQGQGPEQEQDPRAGTSTRTRSEGRDLYKNKIRGQGPLQEQDPRAGTCTRTRFEGRDLNKNKIQGQGPEQEQDPRAGTCTRTRSKGRDLYKNKIRGQGPLQEQSPRAGTSTRTTSEGRDLYKNKIRGQGPVQEQDPRAGTCTRTKFEGRDLNKIRGQGPVQGQDPKAGT
ncbi:cathepsin W-like [Leptodactylus fuscus]|uniref:cathepsin W-like n=1 Tax=Leptodactylus fuscus TaxID=238119 RepID=UPI003F4E4641